MDGKKIPAGRVRLACGWVLLSACAIALGHYHLSCDKATSVQGCGCVELTGTKAAHFSVLWIGTLCCAGSQATLAALALLLPGCPRWVSRELVNIAVAVAGAGHYMYHRAIFILRPEDYFLVASLLFMVVDIICVMALYVSGEE